MEGGGLMTGSDRRNAIVEQIRKSAVPVPGRNLAAEFDVSRQVIVQDIALLRAGDREILSTNRGYVCKDEKKLSGSSGSSILMNKSRKN